MKYPIYKAGIAWSGVGVAEILKGIGISTWGEAAAAAAFFYTTCMIVEWVWKRFIKRQPPPPPTP